MVLVSGDVALGVVVIVSFFGLRMEKRGLVYSCAWLGVLWCGSL